MREAERWGEIEEKKAEKRKKSGKGIEDNLTQNFVEGSRSDRETYQIVASRVGLGSRETYRKAKKIWLKAKERQGEKLGKGQDSSGSNDPNLSDGRSKEKARERQEKLGRTHGEDPSDKYLSKGRAPPYFPITELCGQLATKLGVGKDPEFWGCD